MPKYKIKDSATGKTITIRGDTPPTDADLDYIFSNLKDTSQKVQLAGIQSPDSPQSALDILSKPIPGIGQVAELARETIPSKIAEVGGKFGFPKTAAAVATGISTAGELIPKTLGEAGLMAVGGPIAKGIGRLGAKAAPSIISALTRIEKPIVERGIARVSALGAKELRAPEVVEQGIEKLGKALVQGKADFGQRFARVKEALIERNLGKSIPTADIGARLEKNLASKGFGGTGKIKRELSSDVTEILNDLKNKNLSFQDAVNLKSKIDDLVSFNVGVAPKTGDVEGAILKGVRREIDSRLEASSPLFKTASRGYAKVAKAYDDLSRDLLSGKVETIERRISNIFKKGSVDRKIVEKIDRVSEEAAGILDNVLDAITAQKFRPIINPGVARAAAHTGGGLMGPALGIGGTALFGAAPTALVGSGALAATSPRLAGLAIRGAKALTKPRFAGAAINRAAPAIPGAASLSALALARKRKEKK